MPHPRKPVSPFRYFNSSPEVTRSGSLLRGFEDRLSAFQSGLVAPLISRSFM